MTTTIVQEDFSPRYTGDLSHPLLHQFVDATGAVFDLTGVNPALMTFTMRSHVSGVTRAGQGSWAFTSLQASAGQAVYTWAAADVAVEGMHDIQASVPFADGTQHFKIRELQFLAPLAV